MSSLRETLIRVIAESLCPPDAPYCVERMTEDDAIVIADAVLAVLPPGTERRPFAWMPEDE